MRRVFFGEGYSWGVNIPGEMLHSGGGGGGG